MPPPLFGQPIPSCSMLASKPALKPISLTAGELAGQPYQTIVQAAVKALYDGKTHYSPIEGIYDLRTEIAGLYRPYQADVGPENILITPGVRQAVFNILTNTIRPGDEVIVPAPHYFGFPGIIGRAGGTLRKLETSAKDNFRISPEALERAINPNTRLFIFNNPCNPGGRIYSPTETEELAEVLQGHPQVHILADEIYEFVNYGYQFRHFGIHQAVADRLITVSGFSKAFNMAGFRIGWLSANEKMVQQCKRYQEVTLGGVSLFTQYAALEALRTRNEYLPGLMAELTEKRDRGLEILRTVKGLTCTTPEGAYYFFPEVSAFLGRAAPGGRPIITCSDLAGWLNNTFKVQVFGGDLFGMPNHLRISFSGNADDLYEALNRIKQAFNTLSAYE